MLPPINRAIRIKSYAIYLYKITIRFYTDNQRSPTIFRIAVMIGKKYVPIILLSTSLMASIPAHADSSSTSKVGDVLAFAIPTAAYGSTYYMDDKEGRQQFYYS